jgi:hypothetical protein
MSDPIDGFYSAYTTGKQGQGFAMIVLMADRLIGADATGFLFDGTYSTSDKTVSVSMSITAPPNMPRVQGGLTGPEGESSHIDFDIPRDFALRDFIRIETKEGPVNVKLVKLNPV